MRSVNDEGRLNKFSDGQFHLAVNRFSVKRFGKEGKMGYYGGYYGYYFDPTYFLVLIGAVLCIWAQARVTSTYNKYSRVQSRTGMTGAQAAQRILQMSGIYDVRIEHVRGSLTDHYDPAHKVLRLSDSVYGSTSVAAIGVAAHECGHAVQHDKGYAPLKIRSALVPAANIGSKAGIPLILLGALLGMNHLRQCRKLRDA